jgi:hypothetical protein
MDAKNQIGAVQEGGRVQAKRKRTRSERVDKKEEWHKRDGCTI